MQDKYENQNDMNVVLVSLLLLRYEYKRGLG